MGTRRNPFAALAWEPRANPGPDLTSVIETAKRRLTTRRPTFLIALIAVVGLSAVLAALVSLPLLTRRPPSTPAPAARSKSVDISELNVGDCYAEDYSDETVAATPCRDNYDGVVTWKGDMPSEGGSFPGDDRVDVWAEARCREVFTQHNATTGQNYADFSWWTPDRQTWDRGDHSVVCDAR